MCAPCEKCIVSKMSVQLKLTRHSYYCKSIGEVPFFSRWGRCQTCAARGRNGKVYSRNKRHALNSPLLLNLGVLFDVGTKNEIDEVGHLSISLSLFETSEWNLEVRAIFEVEWIKIFFGGRFLDMRVTSKFQPSEFFIVNKCPSWVSQG